MSRDEFLARWERMPNLKHAELIDGVVYMPSPLSVRHSTWDAVVIGLVFNYTTSATACEVMAIPTCLVLDGSPQPDCVLRILPEFGGLTRTEGKLLSGRPELVVEICPYDLGPKLDLYRRAGIPEYIAVLVEEQRFEWRVLSRGSYRMMKADAGGILRSKIFPGLWIDEGAYWRKNRAQLMSVLNQGLASPEHRRFVAGFERTAVQ